MRTTAALIVVLGVMLPAPAAMQAPAKPAQKPPAARPAAKEAPAQPTPGAGPIVVVETVKGTFEFETYPDEAPKTVEHVLRLVKRNFYNGLRVHRSEPNFVVQLGDPQTRDMTKREWWGRGAFAGSGAPVGVAEFSKKHLHVRGAVAMAHSGNAAQADAQFYVLRSARPGLNGKYAVFGRVISGMDVVDTLQVADVVKRVSIKP